MSNLFHLPLAPPTARSSPLHLQRISSLEGLPDLLIADAYRSRRFAAEKTPVRPLVLAIAPNTCACSDLLCCRPLHHVAFFLSRRSLISSQVMSPPLSPGRGPKGQHACGIVFLVALVVVPPFSYFCTSVDLRSKDRTDITVFVRKYTCKTPP